MRLQTDNPAPPARRPRGVHRDWGCPLIVCKPDAEGISPVRFLCPFGARFTAQIVGPRSGAPRHLPGVHERTRRGQVHAIEYFQSLWVGVERARHVLSTHSRRDPDGLDHVDLPMRRRDCRAGELVMHISVTLQSLVGQPADDERIVIDDSRLNIFDSLDDLPASARWP